MTTGMVMVMGEISTSCYVDIPKIVRQVIGEIGYDRAKYGFDADTCAVLTCIDEQSSDIALGVDKALEAKSGSASDADETGAGDQGMMFGFACDETPELMPLPISLAHKPVSYTHLDLVQFQNRRYSPDERNDGSELIVRLWRMEYHAS